MLGQTKEEGSGSMLAKVSVQGMARAWALAMATERAQVWAQLLAEVSGVETAGAWGLGSGAKLGETKAAARAATRAAGLGLASVLELEGATAPGWAPRMGLVSELRSGAERVGATGLGWEQV